MMEQIRKKQIKELIIIGSVVIGLLAILIFAFILAKNANGESEVVKENEEKTQTASSTNPFDDVRLSARAAYVKDIRSGKVLYQKNPDEALPLASLTKVMTSLTAIEILEDESLVQIPASALMAGNDAAFIAGENFRLQDILNVTLVASSNSAARALALAGGSTLAVGASGPLESFVDKMNAIASKVGMEKTSFKNPTGLDEKDETEAGAVGSARDISKLFEYVLENYPEMLEATREDYLLIKSKEGFEHRVVNTNEIVGSLPNIVGSKTGYTDIAGGNLAVVIDPGLNTPVVIVVLGSSKEGRFKDVERLSNATLDYFLINK